MRVRAIAFERIGVRAHAPAPASEASNARGLAAHISSRSQYCANARSITTAGGAAVRSNGSMPVGIGSLIRAAIAETTSAAAASADADGDDRRVCGRARGVRHAPWDVAAHRRRGMGLVPRLRRDRGGAAP
jgi:hypothetical protein